MLRDGSKKRGKCPALAKNVTNHDEIKVLFSNRYVVGLYWCLSLPWSQRNGKNPYIIWSSVLMHMWSKGCDKTERFYESVTLRNEQLMDGQMTRIAKREEEQEKRGGKLSNVPVLWSVHWVLSIDKYISFVQGSRRWMTSGEYWVESCLLKPGSLAE